RRPESHQHHPERSRQGDDGGGAAGGEEIPRAVEPDVDRSAAGGGWRRPMRIRIADCGSRIAVVAALVALSVSPAAGQDRPAVGPERPFQLAPRVERTLPNGLRVIAT